MNIAVVGTGYVGLVSSVCLASLGHEVVGIDIDAEKVAGLQAGIPGIFERGLEDLLDTELNAERISFSTDIGEIADVDVLLVAVGTPQSDSGEADLSAVYAVVRDAAAHLKHNAIVATKSTVPVGTGDVVKGLLAESGRSDVSVASNPEFLRQGYAVHDFLHPDRVVVGADDSKTLEQMASIYTSLAESGVPVLRTNIKTAELIKYATNAFLATKLAYVNEMADLCEIVGASIEDVTFAVGLDERISSSYMTAGPGFGGSCLPKDTQALLHTFSTSGARSHMVSAAVAANHHRRAALADRVISAVGHRPDQVAVWGLTFKADTDDLRDSPSIDLIRGLTNRGVEVVIYDPLAKELPDGLSAIVADSAIAAATGSDAVVIATEWPEFVDIDIEQLAEAMSGTTVVDFRNSLTSEPLNRAGLDHFPLGRPSSRAGTANESRR
ncbi:MAG: UDP-glucose/GDP-mannose dehydrogenase family protein [Acidimicrobiia bacterium]|nr:MAG: UDP-glucose/GDP-mannose dehydrogenase family protein [Acidimicrobiia bacterium]